MLSKKIIKAAAIAISVVALTACSTAQKGPVCDGSDSSGYGGNGGNGVTASGIGQGTDFSGDGRNNVNAMQVGNQTYYFDFDSNNVHDCDIPSIKVQANYLATHPRAKVLLAGNTDERGSREYNIGLGERRATAVEAVLEANGVSKKQITVVSYGAEKPVALGHDEDSYSKNRRVDLIYQTSCK